MRKWVVGAVSLEFATFFARNDAMAVIGIFRIVCHCFECVAHASAIAPVISWSQDILCIQA